MSTIYNLPKEMMEKIMMNLDGRSASCFYVTCKYFNNMLCDSFIFWRHLCQDLYLTTWDWNQDQIASSESFRNLYHTALNTNKLLLSPVQMPVQRLVMNPDAINEVEYGNDSILRNAKILKLPEENSVAKSTYSKYQPDKLYYDLHLEDTVFRYFRYLNKK